jgi:ribonuclease P protein component
MRRVRELFRHRPIDATMASLDIVAIPRREAVEAPFVMLEHDFQSALRKLRSRR